MLEKLSRLPALAQVLLLLALLLTMIPTGIAFGEGDVEDSSTEAAPGAEAPADAAAADDAPAEEAADESTDTAPADAAATADGAAEAEPEPAQATATNADANDGPYTGDPDGSPSGNGNGGGGDDRPCAGCVGNADDKNPPGQLPGPDDDGDNGYECDSNSGGGKTNPAHSGCPDPAPALQLEKDGPATTRVGETITYTFKVTNTGNTQLTNVHVTDPLIGTGTIAVTPSTLPAGGSGVVVVATGSADYTVKASDVVGNNVHNVATARGTPPAGDDVTDTDPHDVAIVPENLIPAISVTKDGPASAMIGDTITYTFLVRNTGKTTLTNVHITDPLIGGGQIAVTPSTLGPDETGTATAQYTVDADDVVNGEVPNTATAHGTPPNGPPVTDTDDHVVVIMPRHTICHATGSVSNPYIVFSTSVKGVYDGHFGQDHQNGDDIIPPFQYLGQTWSQNWPEGREIFENGCNVPDPEITLVKDGPGTAQVGQVITYTFDVTNTGGTALTNVHITDPLLGTGQIAVTPSTLAPGESGMATATYTVDQADAVGNVIHNEATATGTPPTGPDVTDVDPHDVTLIPEEPPPAIRLDKDGPDLTSVGATITYTFDVTNTSVQTLSNVYITDPLLGEGQIAVTPSTLPGGASGTATAEYTVEQADVIDDNIHNVATVFGTTSGGQTVTDDDPHDVAILDCCPPPASIQLLKDGPAFSQVGDTITYTFDVTNNGTATLNDVHITDPLLGTGRIAVTPSTLAAGATGTATADYTVQQADVVDDEVHNLATVSGQPDTGPAVTDTDPHVVEILDETPPPSINLQKGGPTGVDKAGDVITYTFTVTNTGQSTLSNVHVTDPMLGTGRIPVTPSTLPANGVGTAEATYTVTEADAQARQIVNVATAHGTDPRGLKVNDDDDHLVIVPPPAPPPGIQLEKTGPATANVGDTITYRFTATNTGERILTNVTITDPMLGGELTVTPSTLEPGDVGTASATYKVTAADGRRGEIFNTAIVTGDPPTGPPVTDRDTHRTDVPDEPVCCDPDDPDLPATGTDVPTKLLVSALALMMGFGLLRMTRQTAPAGPTTWSIQAPRLSGAQSPPPVHNRRPGGWSTPRIG